jgi:hypothetical protein
MTGDPAALSDPDEPAGTGSEQTARGLLGKLQDAVSRKDLAALLDLFDDAPVLFGSAAESVGADEVRAYLLRVLEHDASLRWEWDRVIPLLHEPGALAFSVIGTVGFDDESGNRIGEREPFRLTCLAVRREAGWRLRHFHGSVPQA